MSTKRQPTPDALLLGNILHDARGASKLTLNDVTLRALDAGMDAINPALLSSYEHGRYVAGKDRYVSLLAICGITSIPAEAEAAYHRLIEGNQSYGQVSPGQRIRTLSHKRFIHTWQTSETLTHVCAALNISRSQAYSRANYLRDHGVPLKKFSSRVPKEDWPELVKYAQSVLPDDAETR